MRDEEFARGRESWPQGRGKRSQGQGARVPGCQGCCEVREEGEREEREGHTTEKERSLSLPRASTLASALCERSSRRSSTQALVETREK
jgi:hypothetical protein